MNLSDGVHDVNRSEEPTERLTRLCDAMLDALHRHPEYSDDVQAIIFLDDGNQGGMAHEGYGDDIEAVAAMFMHITALLKAAGKGIQIFMLDD